MTMTEWSEFEEVRLHQTSSNHRDVGGSRPLEWVKYIHNPCL